ncbi:hypothetical protein HZU73_09353 [Apis mellifera caucasica]|nr:hypothetical protein HZU73_09353 [Apis mellifera caucasica]
MPARYPSVQQMIVNVIKRFKFEDLESSVMPIFPELSWTDVRSKLVKNHKNFTSVNVAQIIKIVITEAKLQKKILRDRLSILQLIDISWHSNKKVWYGYTLIGPTKATNYIINREVQNIIQDHFDSLDMKINVKINAHNGIIYVSLTESKTKKGKIQYTIPIFFALFVGQKYFFSTKKQISSEILEGIVKSLGYTDSRRFKLMGRDLKSLSELCWKKKEGTINSENINKILIFKDGSPDKKETGIDFTQQKQRKKYAEACFGDNPPILEVLVVNGHSIPLSHKDILAKLPNENIGATWEFRSHNIVACLTKLIERRILITPVPYYISNLLTLGKNELILKND